MKFLLLIFIFSTIVGCSRKNKDSNNTSTTTLIDNVFTEQFKPLELKFSIADTSLDKNIGKEKSLKIFGNKYFPDSLIFNYFDRNSKLLYYPIGKAQNVDQEVYILMKVIGDAKKAAYLMCYDNKLNYKDGVRICQTDGDKKTTYLATIDKYFNIMIRRTDFLPGQEPNYTEQFLAYNNIGKLDEVVLNDTDEELGLINPIDTLKQTKKFTGDYYFDKDNLISLRDSKDSGELIFFYHYDKDKQDCFGEIKDKIKITGANTAVYFRDGDPCMMNIFFGNNTLTIKEDHGCGNKKNAFTCTLDGTFAKQTKKGKEILKPKQDPMLKVKPILPKGMLPDDPNALKDGKKKLKKSKSTSKGSTKSTSTTPVTPKKGGLKQPDIQ